MNREILNNFKKVFIYILIYVCFSAIIIYFNLNRRYLIFNVGLSLIPYIISTFCVNHKNKVFLCFIGLVITTIFYPNAIYMFTDLIHIKTHEYYVFSGGNVNYIQDYTHWIKLSCDTVMVVLSLVLSFESFVNILKILRCYGYKIASFILLMLYSGICGIAVYIGRFLRFNSWDILQIRDITTSILSSATENDYMLIGIFAIVHFVIILMFFNLKNN
ncbi:DUF1361 domain-containing protein [Peptoniphilus mikwangii]|uniref:DUF1361 domain-containing protein n=1 Tax=Peptoniphilus mikwangii TaxID=1354300 RepID=UPI000415BCF5|nr:DUF1361 domain-containing protein [Peptoniphilus mikwangii]